MLPPRKDQKDPDRPGTAGTNGRTRTTLFRRLPGDWLPAPPLPLPSPPPAPPLPSLSPPPAPPGPYCSVSAPHARTGLSLAELSGECGSAQWGQWGGGWGVALGRSAGPGGAGLAPCPLELCPPGAPLFPAARTQG